MKLMKKALALSLSTILTVGMVSTVYAEPPRAHALFGTEKEYGEDNIPWGSLYEGTDDDDYVSMGNKYFIVPKDDTISFDNIDFSHNIEIKWWLNGVSVEEKNGTIALGWEDLPDKEEKMIKGKEYPVFPAELQEAAMKKKAFYDSADNYSPIFYTEEFWKTQVKYSSEPFIILTVTDYDLGWEWPWVYQVVDNWSGPNSVGNVQTTTATWIQDEQGWRILNTDGTYLINVWYQSPASGLWYYMGADGYMLTNTTTPDGYKVNADGVWVP